MLRVLALAALLGAAPQEPASRPRLGINLSGPADWNTELPFVDVFRLSRRWISQKKGAPWGKGPALDLDERGWVRRLEPDAWAEAVLCTLTRYPGGEYAVFYEGEGELDAAGAGRVAAREPGRLRLEVDPSKGSIFLRLLKTNPEKPVRNIRVVMPGFAETYRDQPFHPSFLKRWQGVACLRFMDWMETNNSKVAAWADRPVPEDATFTHRGVPLEVLIDLSNRLKADPWICIPHRADDEYVRKTAEMAKARLDLSLRVTVEYSNEVWNGQFEQSRFAGEEGKKLGFGERPWEAGWRYTAHRSVRIFAIWEEVFGGTTRLVRVLPSQSANAYVSKQIVEFQDAWKRADALAVAPYLSFNIPARGEKLTSAEVATWTVDQVLDHVEKVSLPESVRWMREQKAVAAERNLRLVAYEGGQHLVGVAGGENSEALTTLLHAANAHPRMGVIYAAYLKAWADEGGDLFCHFSSVSDWSKWGSWGLLRFHDDDPARSPKFAATMRWARSLGQPVQE